MATSLEGPETRLPAARSPQESLMLRLEDPKTLDALNRLLDRLDVIAWSAEALEGFLGRAEVVAESVAQGLADLRRISDAEGGGELIAKLPQLARTAARLSDLLAKPEVERLLSSGLLEKLADERTLKSLDSLLSRLEVVAFGLEALEGFLARGNEVAESMAEGAGQLVALAPQVDGEQLRKALSALPSLVEAGTLLADAGMFEARTVNVLADLGRSVADSHEEVRTTLPKPLGLLTLLRALRDPQIARSLQVALETAKRYGRQLE